MIASLVASMTARDPASRPDAADALKWWRHVRSQAYTIQRYWRVRSREESLLGSVFRDVWALVSSIIQTNWHILIAACQQCSSAFKYVLHYMSGGLRVQKHA